MAFTHQKHFTVALNFASQQVLVSILVDDINHVMGCFILSHLGLHCLPKDFEVSVGYGLDETFLKFCNVNLISCFKVVIITNLEQKQKSA